jgi:glycerophosphoryl diester phosphodiesterase
MPESPTPDSRFLDCTGPIAMAHRGFAAGGDENSMAAFARAVELGYRYLETDVRVTGDGVALAFHDARLDRVTDRRGRVDAQPWSVVQRARIAGREPIPRLDEVLDTWPDVRVNVDVKSDRGIGPAVDAIRRTRSVDRVCVAAFSTTRIAALRAALGPRLCTSLGPREALNLRWRPVRAGQFAGRCAQVPARIGPRRLIDARYLAAAHRAGAVVHAWTVNSRTEMVRLVDLGVDGIITDRADVLREVLGASGLWSAAIVPAKGKGHE